MNFFGFLLFYLFTSLFIQISFSLKSQQKSQNTSPRPPTYWMRALSSTIPSNQTLPPWDRIHSTYLSCCMGGVTEIQDRWGITGSARRIWRNTCAMRMSWSLLESDALRVNGNGNIQCCTPPRRTCQNGRPCHRCSSTKRFTNTQTHTTRALVYRVKVLDVIMWKAFGPPSVYLRKRGEVHATHEQMQPFRNTYGIIEFRIRFRSATGHFDLWDGHQMSMISTGHIGSAETAYYFRRAFEVLLWETPDGHAPPGGTPPDDDDTNSSSSNSSGPDLKTWTPRFDRNTSRYYFVNNDTGKVSWRLPSGQPWRHNQDSKDRIYFYHQNTKETKWNL